jgi:hypothetical protein
LGYLSHHSSWATFPNRKMFQVCYPHHFPPDVRPFSWVGIHSKFVFVLKGGCLQTKLVAEEIFPTI